MEHSQILDDAVKRLPILEGRSDSLIARFILRKNYRIFFDAVVTSKPNIVFTDGSKTMEGTGTGIYSEELNFHITQALGKISAVFQGKLAGIALSAKTILMHSTKNKITRIFSDSRAALQARGQYKITFRLVSECHEVLEQVTNSNTLQLVWVKGHAGTRGNEKADKLSRLASKQLFYGPEPTLPLTVSTVNNLIIQDTQAQHKAR